MTAPDKPLHEQCAEHTSAAYHGLWVVKARRLLRESAAELSRTRTALTASEEELKLYRDSWRTVLEYASPELRKDIADLLRAHSPAIAERALTAGSGE